MKQRIIKFTAALLAVLCLLTLLPVHASAIHMNIRVAVKGKCPPYHFWDCLLYTSPSPRDCS